MGTISRPKWPAVLRKLVFLLTTLTLPLWLVLDTALILVLFAIRTGVWLIAKCLRRDLIRMVSGTDNILLFEEQKTSPFNVVGATVVDGHLHLERFKKRYEDLILSHRNSESELVFGKLRCYFTSFLGYHFWKEEDTSYLDHHVRMYDYKGELALPEICTQPDIERVLGVLARLGWHPNKSPWEIMVHHKYLSDIESAGEFKTIVIGRTSHVLGDGFSGLELTRLVTGSPFSIPDFKIHARMKLTRWAKIGMCLRIPWDLFLDSHDVMTFPKFRHFPAPKNEERRYIVAVSAAISTDVIKRIKIFYGVGFNSVIASVITGSIKRAIQEGGRPAPEHLGFSFVVPVPNHPGGMVNHATLVVAKFSCGNASCTDRLEKIHKRIETISRRTTPAVLFKVPQIVQAFPVAIKTWAASWLVPKMNSCCVSNLPATTSTDYIDGLELSDTFGVLSACREFDVTIVVGGLNNRLRFNFLVEKSFFASENIIRSLGRYVEEEIRELGSKIPPASKQNQAAQNS